LYGEFSYYLPIGLIEKEKLLCNYISQTKTNLIIVESLDTILNCDTQSNNFLLAVPFSTFPVQPVLFFNKDGFSYFDQGILKSKYFKFRSPGSIYTGIPFDHSMGIHWYRQQHGVVSVLKNNFYVIYDLSLDDGSMGMLIDGTLQKLHTIFPFIFQDTLFYVSQDAVQSKIIVQNNGQRTVVFETDQARIFHFAFFDDTTGILGLYDKNRHMPHGMLLDFYTFCYCYETERFETVYSFSTMVPLDILENLVANGLFPWCFQPFRLNGEMYGIDYQKGLLKLIKVAFLDEVSDLKAN
jgi:hypothetical protein